MCKCRFRINKLFFISGIKKVLSKLTVNRKFNLIFVAYF